MESEDKPTDENLSFFDVKQETLEETAEYGNFGYSFIKWRFKFSKGFWVNHYF